LKANELRVPKLQHGRIRSGLHAPFHATSFLLISDQAGLPWAREIWKKPLNTEPGCVCYQSCSPESVTPVIWRC